MKYLVPAASLAFLVLLALPGCQTKSEVDTTKLETSFQTAPPETKAPATKAIDAIKAGNYQGALAELQPLLANLKLTREQKTAVQDTIAKIQAKIAAGVKGATESAKKALEGMPKLPEPTK